MITRATIPSPLLRHSVRALSVTVMTAVALAGCGTAHRVSHPPVRATLAASRVPVKHERALHPGRRSGRSRDPLPRRHAMRVSVATPIQNSTAFAPADRQAGTRAQAVPASRPTPIPCLRRAHLVDAAAQGHGVWIALQRRAGNAVYVEGPFRSHRTARHLARSLVGKLAIAGGPYVVISPLGVHLDTQVASVARCLRTAKPGSGGAYHF